SPRLDLTVSLDRVTSAPDRGIDAVAGTATLTGGRLDQADLRAKAGGRLSLSYQPSAPDGAIALHLMAEDAGAALAGLGITGVRGGTLALDGETRGADTQRMTRGTLDMRNFRL